MSFQDFRARLSFHLDDYQVEACRHLEAGAGVLVAAPTGAGKTVVGEYAVYLAHQAGTKCFYTTPIKALSNQKYRDLAAVYGPEAVGLLTGDQVINSEADIAVMTTEVLRNMIYAGSPTLQGLEFVVMDEVHYLSDPFRGPVWEEVILGLEATVKIVALSATVSNVEEFGQWLTKVRGNLATVVSERRPVPLFQHVFAGKKLLDLFQGEAPTAGGNLAARVNPELMRLASTEARAMRDDSRQLRGRSGRGKRGTGSSLGGRPHGRWAERSHLVPRRTAVVADLAGRDLLPAIYFIFSRQGCDQAVSHLVEDGLTLTTGPERDRLRVIAEQHITGLEEADLDALRYRGWLEAFTRGIAAHHAGLLPMFKLAVEDAFSQGLVKVVCATETLALGINMPARTVVLDKLVKYNGVGHADITPGEYTQLTGRAGRRGIDIEGHAVVTWQAGIDPRALAGLASRRTYPLRSAFTPTYNMAVNLIASVGASRARQILEDSFAQFRSDLARTAADKTRSHTLVAKFEAICSVLESLGYVAGDPLTVTQAGRRLARLYGAHDLLIAEAIEARLFDHLSLPSLAATLSTLVYEARLADRGETRLPDRDSARAVEALRKLARGLVLAERDRRLEPAPPLDIGFAPAAYAW
ncbi:MAG: DEAD/DEAH box helicase, partial [Propionibacteriaceae bacterium]|nr:DEAD/DEAH box helicase [Propionibacteriaceae bacterium]